MCPFHLPCLTQLFAAFPDATVVWTDRGPCRVHRLYLYETLMKLLVKSWTIDKYLGQVVMKYTSIALDNALAIVDKASKTMRIRT